jgi:hypothetical protein
LQTVENHAVFYRFFIAKVVNFHEKGRKSAIIWLNFDLFSVFFKELC